jgi:hypothetical protein
MLINLVPVRMDQMLQAEVKGEALILNGATVDFSGLAEGAVAEAASFGCDWLIGDVLREKGEVILTLILPHGADAPEETRFPKALRPSAKGKVALPPHGAPDLLAETSDLEDKGPAA